MSKNDKLKQNATSVGDDFKRKNNVGTGKPAADLDRPSGKQSLSSQNFK